MASIVTHKGYDFNLSYGQKKFATWSCGVIAFLAFVFYSTPNTIEVFTLFTKDISFFGLAISGYMVGVVLGLIVNFGELTAIYFSIWKSNFFWFVVVILGAWSVFGSYIFQETGNMIANTKKKDIASQVEVKNYWAKMIESENEYMNTERKSIEGYAAQRQQYASSPSQWVPSWIERRIRQCNDKISASLIRKKAYTDSLKNALGTAISKEKEYGIILSYGDPEKSKKISLFIALLAELIFVGFTFLSLIIHDAAQQNKEKGKGHFVVGQNGTLRKRKRVVKDVNLSKTRKKVFAGKEQSNEKTHANFDESLRKEIVKRWLGQVGEVEQGIRDKTNMTEIAKELGCQRQNVHYHLKQEGLI